MGRTDLNNYEQAGCVTTLWAVLSRLLMNSLCNRPMGRINLTDSEQVYIIALMSINVTALWAKINLIMSSLYNCRTAVTDRPTGGINLTD